MNLSHLRYFVTLAHVCHYTHAAEELCISQPSLSHAISGMERELGVRLFEKSGRTITLTPYGEEFLACAEQTLATLDAGVSSLQRAARGEGLVRLGLVRPMGIDFVPGLARGFLEANPELDVEFTFDTGTTNQLLDRLESRQIDLAFCSQPPEGEGLMAIPVHTRELVVATPKDHPLVARKPSTAVTVAELAQYPLVAFSGTAGIRVEIDALFEEAHLTPTIVCETEEDEVVAGLVAHGFGLAVLPRMAAEARPDLVAISIASPLAQRHICLVSDSAHYLAPAARRFHEYVLGKVSAGRQPPVDS